MQIHPIAPLRSTKDLDEIVSHKVLRALKWCKPGGGVWRSHVRMKDLTYSVAWSRLSGFSDYPTTVGFMSEHEGEVPKLARDLGFIDRPNELSAMDGSHVAWHFSFMLNSSALAHKLFIRVEGRFHYAQGFQTEADLATFIENTFYSDPSRHDPEIHPSNVGKKDLPQALSEHPEKFPNILRNVTW